MIKQSPYISYLGELSEQQVSETLKQSDIFLLPRSTETFGLVFLEAAAKGNVIIGYKNSGVDGVFENEKNAFFINSKRQLIEVLKQIITNKKINYYKEKANHRVKELTWEKVIKLYKNYYENIL